MFEKLKSAHENLADEMEKEHKEFVQSCKDSICDEYDYKNIVVFANEVTVKKDIIDIFSATEPNLSLIMLLTEKERPLEYIYQEWMKKEDSLSEDMLNLFEDLVSNRGGFTDD